MKKLLMFIFVGMFMISFATAFEFDNVKKYDEETRTVTIENAFGLGADIATVKLNTPQVFLVGEGYQKVAEFTLNSKDDYVDAFKELEFYDIKDSNRKFIRNFDYKTLSYESVRVDDYGNVVVGIDANKSNIYERQIVGSHFEQREVWTNLLVDNFTRDQNVTIGIFTYVEMNDHVEWIPNIMGIRINEWAAWSQSLEAGLRAYYKFEETSGVVVDEFHAFNGTAASSPPRGIPGVQGNQICFHTAAQTVNFGNIYPSSINEGTLNFWINSSETNPDTSWLTHDGPGQINDMDIGFGVDNDNWDTCASTDLCWESNGVMTLEYPHAAITNFPGVSHMVTVVVNGSAHLLYIDSVLRDTFVTTDNMWGAAGSEDVVLGTGFSNSIYSCIDELSFSDRDWSAAEVTEAYNLGDGATINETSNLTIIIISPEPDFISPLAAVTFEVQINHTFSDLENASLFTNESGSFARYNFTTGIGTNETTVSWIRVYDDKDYIKWGLEVCDENDFCVFTDNNTFVMDTSFPNITITAPGDLFDYVVVGDTLDFNWTVTDDDIDVCWYDYNTNNVANTSDVSIPVTTDDPGTLGGTIGTASIVDVPNAYDGDLFGSVYSTFTGDISSSPTTWTFNQNFTTNSSSLLSMDYRGIFKADGCTQNGVCAKIVTAYCVNKTDRTDIQIATFFPAQYATKNFWNLIAGVPQDCLGSDDIFEVKTLMSAAGSGGTASIINMRGTLLEYTNIAYPTNQTVACNLNTTTFILEEGNNDIVMFANDTSTHITREYHSWNYTILSTSETYSATTVESSIEEFVNNITYTSSDWDSIVVVIEYDGVNFTTAETGSGDDLSFSYGVTIPFVTVETNKTFNWFFTLTNATGSYVVESPSRNQTVSLLSLGICSGGDPPAINFTTYDATRPFPILNATFKSTWRIYDSAGGSVILNRSYEDLTEVNNTWAFCIEPSTSNYTLSMDIEVDGAEHSKTWHYITDAITSNITYSNVSLYLLNDSAATLTEFIVTDGNQQPIPDIIITSQFYDVGTDTFYTTGMMKTSTQGADLAYFNWFDSLYKFIFVLDGEVIHTTTPYKISETPQLFSIDVDTTFGFDKFRDALYSLYYNETSTNFVLTFIKPSAEVVEGCLNVIKRNITSDYTICDVCSSSSSATLYCNIGAEGNGTFIATYYATGSFYTWPWISEKIGNGIDLFAEIGNENGTIMAIIFSGMIMMLFFVSPVMGMIGLMIGLIGSIALGFQPIDYTSLISILAVGGIAVWFMRSR